MGDVVEMGLPKTETTCEPMTCDPMLKVPPKLSEQDRSALEVAALRAQNAELQKRLAFVAAQQADAEARRLDAAAQAVAKGISERYGINPATHAVELTTGEIKAKS